MATGEGVVAFDDVCAAKEREGWSRGRIRKGRRKG